MVSLHPLFKINKSFQQNDMNIVEGKVSQNSFPAQDFSHWKLLHLVVMPEAVLLHLCRKKWKIKSRSMEFIFNGGHIISGCREEP